VRATPDGLRPHPSRLELTWLGHSTTLFELDGVRLLTDPLLRRRVAHLTRPDGAPGAVGRVDAVLISHAHRDHLDLPSLRLLPHDTPLVVPRGAGRLVARLGFRDISEVAEGDDLPVGDVHVLATHAEHDRGRHLRSRGPVPVGYLVAGSQRAYFAGDTDLFPRMRELSAGLDLALLPIGGWGPRLPAGHLDAEGAAHALALLEPRVCVPIHWGTYRPIFRRKPYEGAAEAGERFAKIAREIAPDVDVEVLQPGEHRTIEGFIRTG